MSGICLAAMLQDAGITDIALLEKAGDLGGTWRDNTYPGLSCDVPSRAYQFTFAKNPSWSRLFAPGPEIHEYFRSVAVKRGITDRIRYNAEVTRAEYVDGQWLVTAGGEELRADFLIAATGILHHPRYPSIAGLSDFAGPVFHSARWDHTADLRDKRVAVVGTGSTGVQIICGLAGQVAHLQMFQRHPQWILPLKNKDYRAVTKRLYARSPRLGQFAYDWYRRQLGFFAKALIKPGWRRQMITRACEKNLAEIPDSDLRQALTPDFLPMCKRLIVSSEFYTAIQHPDVELVTTGIDHVEADAIVTTDGVRHPVDVIALATGFDTHAFVRPTEVIGRDGVTLDETWQDGPFAHLTVAVPGFPNYFMMIGPHSPVGNFSLTAIAEAQAGHIRDWIQRWRRGEFDSVEPSAEATAAYNAEIRDAMPGTIWTSGCESWYLGKDGLPELWPWTPDDHRQRLATANLGEYELRTSVEVPTG
jgi:cation diffusion facilitator CzcD-associated flavoprotein CzcO